MKASETHCRHYSYTLGKMAAGSGPTCAIGVDLSAPGAAPGRCYALAGVSPCPIREPYTVDEIASWKVERTKIMDRAMICAAAIPRDGDGGDVPCPGCGVGMISWSRARSNRHVWAACSTVDCFSMIQ